MTRGFLSLAHELSMLSPDVAEQLTAEVARTGEAPETLVARRGLLSAVQMDIVQTLLRPLEIVPGYELLSTLGHGGMGVVYRARQKTLDRDVAIKTILVNQMLDRSMATRFEQEARAVARLQHPNIIAAIDFGMHDGRLFFVMELVEGEDLESRIDRQHKSGGGASETLAWGLARQTASGLAHAAEQGVVHRDIKPANLLLIAPPAGFPLPPGMPLVKIADFGLAFLATTEADARTRLTQANTAVGSPHYIAPEQISGDEVDSRADIYSLGATIFHLLAGRPPYTGRPMMQILSQKVTADAPRLRSVRADISDVTDQLVADMMARRAEDRVASYSKLLGRIDEVLLLLNSTTLTEIPVAALTVTADLPRVTPPISTAELTLPGRETRTEAFGTTASGRDTAALGATQLISAVASLAGQSRRVWLLRAGAAVLGGASVWGLVTHFRLDTPVHPRLVPSGWSEPLFSGRSLRNWQTRSGTWVPTDDEDGAKVLAGTIGVISRRLLRSNEQPPRPLKHYELSLAVRLHQASAVELHFGLLSQADDNPPRPVLRVEHRVAALTHRAGDRDNSKHVGVSVTLPVTNNDQPRIVRLRRDATDWIATVDGQRIGTLKIAGPAEFAEFRLSVADGPAWFSDIEVEELIEPQASALSK